MSYKFGLLYPKDSCDLAQMILWNYPYNGLRQIIIRTFDQGLDSLSRRPEHLTDTLLLHSVPVNTFSNYKSLGKDYEGKIKSGRKMNSKGVRRHKNLRRGKVK